MAAAGLGVDVAAAGVERRDRVGHRLDAVGQPRQRGEPARQLGVDPLGDPRRAHQQRAGRGRVELRVAAKKSEQVGETPRELGRPHRFLHFAMDPCDLLQADLVDLIRSDVVGRVVADEIRVVGFAVRQRGGGDRLARPRRVFVAEEGLQIPIRGNDSRSDRCLACLSQPRPILRRDRVRKRFERRMQGRILRVGELLRLDDRRHARQDPAGSV